MSWLYPFSGSSSRRNRSRDRHSSRHHYSTTPSLFSLGSFANRSDASSIFSSGGGSSSRRARPRSGFVARMVHKIKRLFRQIVHYAKRHPTKVFLMVVMPLITGGVLQKLLGAVGVRVPKSLMGGAGGASAWGASRSGNGYETGSSGNGIGESLNGLVSLAKMFL